MKWLHLSDIHYDPKGDGSDTSRIRDGLIKDLKSRLLCADELLITGDFRYARKCVGLDKKKLRALAKDIAEYITKVAKQVGIDDVNRIHLIPGNHDIDRNYPARRSIVTGVRHNYDVNEGVISTYELELLISSLDFFFLVVEELYGGDTRNRLSNEMKKNPHGYCIREDYAFVYLNTTLSCGEDGEGGSLVIGTKYLTDTLIEIREKAPNTPIIVIGHHGLRMFKVEERKKVLSIFNEYGVSLYLCGHEHEIWYEYLTDRSLQINMGCLKQENSSQASYSVGEYDPAMQLITVNAFVWEEGWHEYPAFGKETEGLKLWLTPPFSEMKLFSTLPEMFSDAVNHIKQRNGILDNNDIFGFGIDLEVALPYMNHLLKNYNGDYSFRVLVNNKMLINSEINLLNNPFNCETLVHSTKVAKSTNKALEKSKISVRRTKHPYSFFGLMVDDYLYFSWLTVDRDRHIANPAPYYRIKRGFNAIQDNLIRSFTSWFEYFWNEAEEIV